MWAPEHRTLIQALPQPVSTKGASPLLSRTSLNYAALRFLSLELKRLKPVPAW